MAAAAAALQRLRVGNPRLSAIHLRQLAVAPASHHPGAAIVDASPESVRRAKSSIRSESDPDRIAELFLSAGNHPSFHGDRAIYKIAVEKLAAARRRDLVELLLESRFSDPSFVGSEGFLTRVISLYSGAGMPSLAVRTFDRMPELGCRRTERSMCAVLAALLHNRRFHDLRDAFDKVPRDLGISPCVDSHNIYLKGLCLDNDVPSARKLLDEMPQRGVEPNIVSFNILLNAYRKRKNDDGFEEILEEISKKELDQDVVTYNCRIYALCAKGRSAEAEELLSLMLWKKVQPTVFSFNSVIRSFCKEGNVGSAMRLFARMKSCAGNEPSLPNSDTYIVLIRALIEKGEFGSALEVCRECLEKKLAPPFSDVKDLIDGLVKGSRVHEAKGIAEKMRKVTKGDAIASWKKVEGELAL